MVSCSQSEEPSKSKPTNGLNGQADVLDGDTVRFFDSQKTVRLAGIDAPESGQRCFDGDTQIKCGLISKKYLFELIGGREISCTKQTEDSYGRIIGVCFVDGIEINSNMVEKGMAVAFLKYEDTYSTQEEKAKKEKLGIWQYSFSRPHVYRSEKWNAAVNDEIPDPTCPIKGNINSKGVKIYHMPYNRDYLKTRINTSKGERWFCDENEALEAGWRAVK